MSDDSDDSDDWDDEEDDDEDDVIVEERAQPPVEQTVEAGKDSGVVRLQAFDRASKTVLAAGQAYADAQGHAEIVPLHVLSVLLRDQRDVLELGGADSACLTSDVRLALERLASGSDAAFVSSGLLALFHEAERRARSDHRQVDLRDVIVLLFHEQSTAAMLRRSGFDLAAFEARFAERQSAALGAESGYTTTWWRNVLREHARQAQGIVDAARTEADACARKLIGDLQSELTAPGSAAFPDLALDKPNAWSLSMRRFDSELRLELSWRPSMQKMLMTSSDGDRDIVTRYSFHTERRLFVATEGGSELVRDLGDALFHLYA